MADVTALVSARFTNLVARRFPWSLAAIVYPGFDSCQRFTDRQIPVAVLERRAAR
jgi:hypothetical protein